MAREHLVGRDGIAIDGAGGDVHRTVAGVLDAVHHDEAIGRCLADFRGDGGHVHRHAGDGRGVDDGGHAHVRRDEAAVGFNTDVARGVVMRHQHVGTARDLRPARHGAARGGMFQRGRQHDAAGRGTQRRRADEAEQHFRSALAHEDLAIGGVEEQAHVRLALVDRRHQRLRGLVVAALIVRIGGIECRGLDHRLQREGAARILEEHARAIEGAGVHMRETRAHVVQQSGFRRQHSIHSAKAGMTSLQKSSSERFCSLWPSPRLA
jgi:hypothetical protein